MDRRTVGTPPDTTIRRYAFIDALRGLAILGVLMVHTSGWVPAKLPETTQVIARQGARGVQLFFVVSALTLFLSLDTRGRQGEATVWPFLVRRFFRIAPLFWCAVLFYPLVLDGFGPRAWAPHGIGWRHVAATASFLHGWHPATINSVVPGGWTIAVEMTFYLTVPFLFRRLRTLNAAVWALLLGLLLALAADWAATRPLARHFRDYPSVTNWYRGIWFPAQFPVFLVGILLYFRLRDSLREGPGASVPANRGCDGAILVLCVFLLLALCKTGFPPADILYAGVFAVFAEVLARSPSRLFVNPISCYLGRVSYSIYLCHIAVMALLAPRLRALASPLSAHPLAAWAVYFLATLTAATFVATLTYHLIEVPGMAAGRMLLKRLRARGAAAPAPAAARAA